MEDCAISSFFDAYRERFFLWNEWIDKVLTDAGKADWLAMLHERARTLSGIYRDNRLVLDTVFTPMLAAELTHAQYDLIWDKLLDMYQNDWGDPFFIRTIALRLIPFYESKEDPSKLIFLYLCMGYACMEISRTQDKDMGHLSSEYYRRITAYSGRFAAFTDPRVRRWIIVAYVNLILVEPSVGNLSLKEAYHYWQQLAELRSSRDFRRFEDEGTQIGELADAYLEHFRVSANSITRDDADAEPLPTAFQLELDRMSTLAFEEELDRMGSLENCTSAMLLNYEQLLLKLGKQSVDQTWCILDKYFDDHIRDLSGETDIISFYTSYSTQLIELLPQTTLTAKEQTEKACHYRLIMDAFVKRYPAGRNSYTMNSALKVFAFYPAVLDSCGTREEKIRFLSSMVISRHITTFLHSEMVARFADALMRHLIDDRPELLVGCRGCTTPEDVIMNRYDLLRFVQEAALLHDIGKNGLIDIINTQYRPINDLEFQIIRTHPRKGADLLKGDADLRQYIDVALGHHCSFDGQGGYPRDFDVTKTPDRRIISLVTLCDCLDAATDGLGRNYHLRKTVDGVLREFRAGAGTRYDPDLVTLIEEDERLHDELVLLSEHQREEVYYAAYRKYYVLPSDTPELPV